MEILNKLRKITGFDFSGLKKFQGKFAVVFKLFSDNKNVVVNGPVINININGFKK